MTADQTPANPNRRRWRWAKALGVLGLVLLIAALIAPWIIERTALRDWLLNRLVYNEQLIVTSQSANIGYFTPLSVEGLKIETVDESTQLSLKQFKAEKSWLGLLNSLPNLGRFTFDDPAFRIRLKPTNSGVGSPDRAEEDLTEPGAESALPPAPASEPDISEQPEAAGRSILPSFTAEIREAELLVEILGEAEPAIELQHLNLNLHMQTVDDTNLLVIDPAQVLDKVQLTPELCKRGIYLVAPLLADAIGTEGTISLELESFQLPLGSTSDRFQELADVAGTVQLSNTTIQIRDSIIAKVVKLLEKLFSFESPDRVTLIDGTEIQFQLADGLIHHTATSMILPRQNGSWNLTSEGTVSLERDLDLILQVELPIDLVGHAELAKQFLAEPLKIHVTGNLDEPKLELTKSGEWIDRLENVLTATGENGESVLLNRTNELLQGLQSINQDRLEKRQERLLDREDRRNFSESEQLRDGPRLPRVRDLLPRRRQR